MNVIKGMVVFQCCYAQKPGRYWKDLNNCIRYKCIVVCSLIRYLMDFVCIYITNVTLVIFIFFFFFNFHVVICCKRILGKCVCVSSNKINLSCTDKRLLLIENKCYGHLMRRVFLIDKILLLFYNESMKTVYILLIVICHFGSSVNYC